MARVIDEIFSSLFLESLIQSIVQNFFEGA